MKKKNLKYIFILFLIFSVFIQLEGILFFNGEWHRKYDIGAKDQSWLWSIDNTQIVYYLKNPNPETLKWYNYVFYNIFGKTVFPSRYSI